jgi:hypothetical protein
MNLNIFKVNPQNLKNSPLILMPGIFLCISLGFLGFLVSKHAYFEIKAVEYEDISFLSLKIVLCFACITGFLARRNIKNIFSEYVELALILLNILIIYILMNFSSGILQVDYIFHTGIFQLFSFIIIFTSGYFLGSLKKLRLWGFLVGSVSVFGYSFIYKTPELNTETYLIPILCILVTEICLNSFYTGLNKKKVEFKKFTHSNHTTTDVFFYTSITLFVTHSLLFYYRSSGGPDVLVSGGGLGLLIFNILLNLKLINRKVRLLYFIGRIVIILNLILTVQQSYLELFSFWLFFLDLGTFAIFRPREYSSKFIFISIISGVIVAYASYLLHLKYTKSEYLYAFILVIVNLIWLPLILKNSFGILQKLVILAISYGLSLYFFSPLPFNYKIQQYSNENVVPIPYLLSSVELNNEDFVFYNTGLPFMKSIMLPKRGAFKNKIVVLGIRENPEIILTYVKYLAKNSYPYIIYQSRSLPRLTREEILFSYQEFPLFRIYYPENGIAGISFLKPGLPSRVYETDFVENKIKDLSSNEEIADVLLNIIKYTTGDSNRIAKNYQDKFFRSYMKYSDYYFEIKDYRMAIKMAELSMKFGVEDSDLYETTFQSLIRISPEKEHINVMNFLVNKPKYKEEILKRLYPLLLSTGDEKGAIQRMDELIELYQKSSETENNLFVLIEKIKIFIKNQRYSEVEEIIQKEKKKQPNSSIWDKLLADVKYYKETSSKPYYYGIKSPSDLPVYNVGENY